MPLTTNSSRLREKLGTLEGEYELTDTSHVSKAQEDEDRIHETEPDIETVDLGNNIEYVVGAKISGDKKDIQRNKLRRHAGSKVIFFTKKSGA